MDLLQARELPAMDDDGLVDPSYKLEVKDQALAAAGGLRVGSRGKTGGGGVVVS